MNTIFARLNNMNKNFLYPLLSIIFLFGCGGGGGGGSAPAEPSPTATLSSSSSSVLLGSVITLTWSSTNATSCTASGAWSGSKATSGTEDVTISTPGNNQFSISCTGAGGSRSASVTVEGYRNTDGVSVDGYIRQADIFIDTNDSYTADSGEDSTTSDNDGKFTIKYSDGNLISLGGTDLDSGNPLDNLLIVHKLTGHSDFKALTPVTSVAAFMADASLVNSALGIDASLDVTTVDPVAGKGDNGINDYLYEKGNQLTVLAYALQNTTNNLNVTTETTQDYFKAIAEEVDAEYTTTSVKVDIETEAFITKVIDNIITAKTLTVAEEIRSNLITALASVMPVIEVKATDALTTAVFDFATSTLQTDTQAIANGSATADIITSYETDILNYIATDQEVDPDELAPSITAIVESVTTDEDTTIEIDVLANDSYVSSAPISVLAENGINGITTISNNIVSYTPDADFNGSDSFEYTITQGNKVSSATVNITITPINDIPSFDNLLSTYVVDENQTVVTSISASDVEGEALTISLSGTDAASFNLSNSNVLAFNESPDYETKSSYALVVSVTDGIDTLNKDLEVNLNNLNDNAPTFTSGNFNAEENQLSIGTVSAIDADSDSLVYSLDSTAPAENCSSNPCIFLDSNSGLLSFGNSGSNVAPDYEAITSYTFNVKVTDGIYTATKSITVNIINVNDVFPVIETSGFTPEENQRTIGSIIASDLEGDTLSYSMSGADAELITLENNTLSFKSYPDFETKNLYSITISVFDGLNTTTKDIDLNIQDIWSEYAFIGGRYYAPQTSYSITSPDTGQVFTYNFDADWYCEDKHPDQIEFEADDYSYCPTINLSLKQMNKPYHPYSDSVVDGEYYSTPIGRIGDTNEINWTLSFWIRPDEIECSSRHCGDNNPYIPSGSTEIMRGINNIAYVAGNGSEQKDFQFWLWRGKNNELYFEMRDDLANRNNQSDLESDFRYIVSSKNDVLDKNIWTHVLLRCKVPSLVANTECEFFTNGESAIDVAKRGSDYRGSSSTTADAFNGARELVWENISITGAFHALDDLSIWGGFANENEITSIYNSGIPKNLKDFTIQSTKPSIYYRFEKEHLGTYEWINGPLIGGGTIANSAYDIDTELDRNQLDLITEMLDAEKNIYRDVPANKTPETIEVTVAENSNGAGNVYVINGTQNKSISLELGKTYIFNHPTGHPLKFSETSDGTHGGGSEYRSAINTTTPGVTIITPSIDTPAVLYYYCSIHSGMGGESSLQ